MEDLKAKQQVIEKIKSSANIIVTVSDNPTVDALSAAIGLTLLFEKLGKYGTAIFSGVTPPAIAFLEPQKTLDNTTDSLRDFIIALDKEKADHLRYKVEGDAVKIFITPYKTTITSDDLVFSQGDYNVELVIALGVDDQDHLDKALEAHGQIFHDAAVITVTANDQTSSLGGIDWHDEKASSLSEMITGLADSLKKEKGGKSLIDAQIATAFMTGLVAQTERFSNRYTSPQSLTVASSLMAAGADQQLIATKLQEAIEVTQPAVKEPEDTPEVETPEDTTDNIDNDGTLRIIEHNEKKVEEPATTEESVEEPASEPEVVEEPIVEEPRNDNFEVTHDEPAASEEPVEQPQQEQPQQPQPTVEEVPEQPAEEQQEEEPEETLEDIDRRVKAAEQKEAAAAAFEILNHTVPVSQGVDGLIVDDAVAPTPRDPLAESSRADVQLPPPITNSAVGEIHDEPSMGGTLNATAEQAADDARREEDRDRNKTLLSHGGADQEAASAASVPQMEQPLPSLPPTPFDLGLPLPPPLPGFPMSDAPAVGTYAPEQPEILGDILSPEPQANSNYFTPPAPSSAPNYFPPQNAPVAPTPQSNPSPVSNDPGQFKIPGQQ